MYQLTYLKFIQGTLCICNKVKLVNSIEASFGTWYMLQLQREFDRAIKLICILNRFKIDINKKALGNALLTRNTKKLNLTDLMLRQVQNS